MCGIIYSRRKEHSTVKPVLKRYEQQKGRGSDGYGFVAVSEDKVIGYEREENFADIYKNIMQFRDKANEILFHHRFPTSTPNIAQQAHPIVVNNPLLKSKYYLAHNGVLSNEDLRKIEHNSKGFVYTTEAIEQQVYMFADGHQVIYEKDSCFNDSEAFAIDFALWNEGLLETMPSKGSIAFVCLEVDKTTDDVIAVHFGHNDGNPLLLSTQNRRFTGIIDDTDIADSERQLTELFNEEDMVVISSESTAVNKVLLEENYVYSYYHKDKVAKIRKVHVGDYYYSSTYKPMGYTTPDVNKNSFGAYYDDKSDEYYEKAYGYSSRYDDDVPPSSIVSTYASRDTTPIADTKMYHSMNKDELQWEELTLSDELDNLYNLSESITEMWNDSLDTGFHVTAGHISVSTETLESEMHDTRGKIALYERLRDEVLNLLENKFTVLCMPDNKSARQAVLSDDFDAVIYGVGDTTGIGLAE